jgi:protein gp37
MSDLFHSEVPGEYITRVVEVMRQASWHTFQVLTKRAERLERLSRHIDWPSNVWIGVSVESATYYGRIRHLQRVGAAVRFLSCEPLLSPLPQLPLGGIDWVIAGGESGPGARPMDPRWARDVRDQCRHAGVPFFFKQWGAWAPVSQEVGASGLRRLGKKLAGRMLDGRTWDEMPAPVQWTRGTVVRSTI